MMKKLMISVLAASTLAMAGGDIAPVEPVVEAPVQEGAQDWKYGAAIYLWGASIEGTTGTGSPLSIDFEDILDNLRMAGMGLFSATHDKWTLLVDIIYMDINKKGLNISPGPGPIITLNSLGMKSWIVQPIVSYAMFETETDRFELLAGARYISIDIPLGFAEPVGKVTPSEDAWNGIVGVRGTHHFTDKWMGNYHLDVGTGDSDFTWQGVASVGYKFASYDLVVGYRYLEWDHGGKAMDDLNLGGPFAGVKFHF